ncbi:hypothetical protein EK904_006235, partial [Melospiza melodia maxima]
MEFPSSFTSSERAFVHRLCQSLGLVSKSKGKGANRYLTVRKKDVSDAHAVMTCDLALRTKHTVRSLIQSFPVTNKERTELLPRTERGHACAVESENKEVNKTSGRLNDGIPQVPVKRGESEFDSFRQSLPVLEKQEEIVQIIKDNKIVLIIGETGSGKTTQIPQFILDDCYKNGTPCRVFCTQPRRLAAVAVAERVAAERREKIGQTIGYQIRLESRVSPKTLVTFCTNDMLLRTLMAGDSTLSTVTHVIVDEVHERDRFSDFLLIKLRDVLQNQNNLKLIISSAALDANLFIRYFGSCPVIHSGLQGRPFEVKEMFLEDILRSTGYTNKEMVKYKKEKQQEEKQKSTLAEWCSAQESTNKLTSRRQKSVPRANEEYKWLDEGGDTVFNQLTEKDVNCLEPWIVKEMDSCLSDIWLHKDIDSFAQVLNLILTENVSDRESLVLTEPKEKKVRFHPTSVLGQSQYKKIAPANGQAAAIQALPTDWLIYDEMTRAHKTANIRCCSVVTPVTVSLFCGPARLPSNALQASSSFRGGGVSNDSSDSEMEDKTTANLALLKLDEWLHLKLDPEAAGMLLQLRQKWHSLFLRRMRAPSKPWSQVDETTVRAITAVLSAEEQSAGLQQPSGIGQRPRPVTCEELPLASTWKSANSRKSSTETELSDSSNAEKVSVKSTSPALHQPKKYKEKDLLLSKRSSDDRSAQSSVKPADSSSYSSPSASPSSPVSGKGCKSPSPRQNMPVRYFIMKSSNLQNIDISQQKGIWSTTPSNERKLNGAFWESSMVYLIFSVQGSGCFQGFARMGSAIGCEKSQDWGSAGFGGVFKVDWIRKESIPFQFAHHLLNPWNDSKKVQISRDG